MAVSGLPLVRQSALAGDDVDDYGGTDERGDGVKGDDATLAWEETDEIADKGHNGTIEDGGSGQQPRDNEQPDASGPRLEVLRLSLLHHPRRTVAFRPSRGDGRRPRPPLQRPLHRRLLRGRPRRTWPCRRHPHPCPEEGPPHAALLLEAGLSRCRDRRPLRTGGRPQGLSLVPRQHPPGPDQATRLLIPFIYTRTRESVQGSAFHLFEALIFYKSL